MLFLFLLLFLDALCARARPTFVILDLRVVPGQPTIDCLLADRGICLCFSLGRSASRNSVCVSACLRDATLWHRCRLTLAATTTPVRDVIPSFLYIDVHTYRYLVTYDETSGGCSCGGAGSVVTAAATAAATRSR